VACEPLAGPDPAEDQWVPLLTEMLDIRRLFPTELKVMSERGKRIKPQLAGCA
jgi:hypothetical protein